MEERPKILILDDEQDLLELYRDLLTNLPSQPEIFTANNGAKAMSMLDGESFSLLLTDLNMPNMDGFQVLTIVRRKYPALRTVVMSAVTDEQYRTRAYGMGIDLYLEKPGTPQEIKLFSDCIESLLGQESAQTGFRGVQSKSLVDLIQLECMSQSSGVLKMTNRGMEARIWIQDGEIIDAECQDEKGENGFKLILGWKTGNFEMLPPDPQRERTIFNSYQGLLLDSAQSLDEADAADAGISMDAEGVGAGDAVAGAKISALNPLKKVRGVEFLLQINQGDPSQHEGWAVDEPEPVARWLHETLAACNSIGEKLNVGFLQRGEGYGFQQNAGFLGNSKNQALLAGLHRTFNSARMREAMNEISSKWAS